MPGEQPFPCDLGGWETLLADQGIDNLFVDIQKFSHFTGVEKVFLFHRLFILPCLRD
jgi:hypothetical protein